MRDDTEMLIEISRYQRQAAEDLGAPIVSVLDLAEPKPPASLVDHPYGLPRGTFSRPVVVDPVPNHTDLAEKIATARYWERITGVKTPFQIEQIIQSWELDR